MKRIEVTITQADLMGARHKYWGVNSRTAKVLLLKEKGIQFVNGSLPSFLDHPIPLGKLVQWPCDDGLTEKWTQEIEEQPTVENQPMNISETIMKHKIKIEPFENIVYARINNIECGARYRETDGDEQKALELAVSRVVEQVSQPEYQATVVEVVALRNATGRGFLPCKHALIKCRGDQAAAADYLRKF